MTDEKPYNGPERRKEQRRKSADRRDEIRFEPDKEPRRSGRDRRKNQQDIWDRRDF